MRFRILGPVEAHADGGEQVLLPHKPRALLAVLLLETGRRVSEDRLMSALWPVRPPQSAPRVIRTYISVLRRSLSLSHRGSSPRLMAAGGGYRLKVASGDLDMLVFRDLASRGRQALTGGDAATAARLLNQALRLWRGDPAEDVMVDQETGILLAGLAEQRLLAEEDTAEAELALGNEAAVISRLWLLVAAHPLRERLWGQLMTAQYRTGQRAAALAAYQQVRAHLNAELGLDPDPRLQKLHQKILAGGQMPAAHNAATVLTAPEMPRQLPRDVSHFAGRSVELDLLDGLLATDLSAAGVITSISGTAGVGKTALALRWAHRIERQFPDGQLYANLRAAAPDGPAGPLEVLARFLRALRVAPERIPDNLDEAAAMYRSLLYGKRIIVVLDNAASSEQVRPLLPGAGGCVVIVTSRVGLLGLGARDGAILVALAPLLPAEAVRLLRGILGAERADAEALALDAIATACAFLPLALRIAAEKAMTQPHQRLASLAAQLADARDRLNVLATDDDPATSVRAVLSRPYSSLAPETARMFRLLGLHPGPDISVAAAAALAGCEPRQAACALEALADMHLAEKKAAGRYGLHDLMRACAAEQADADETVASRAEAIRRVLTWYLHNADAANQILSPARRQVSLDPPQGECRPVPIAGYEQALTWCETERLNLVAAIETAIGHGEIEIAWKLSTTLANYFEKRKLWAERITHEGPDQCTGR